MLERLRIRNLLVVEEAELEFEPGLNALTGSTGAGKSLVMGAINLLLGTRADPELIRPGADEAIVEARLRVPPDGAGDLAAHASDGVLEVRRVIRRNGRGSAYVSGRAVPVRALADVCGRVVEPHAQQEGASLRDPERHVEVLDAAGVDEGLRRAWSEALAAWRRACAERDAFDARIRALEAERELVEMRVAEIERVDPRPGELERLERELAVIDSAERIAEALAGACESLYDADDAAVERLARSARELERLAEVDPRLGEMAEALERARVTVSETVDAMRSYFDDLEFDPAEAARSRERVDVLRTLERRYGIEADELAEAARRWRAELESIETADDERRELGRRVDEAREALEEAGEALADERERVARALDEAVTTALEELGMRGAAFRTEFVAEPGAEGDPVVRGERVRPDASGPHRVRFRIRTNPGQAEGPLERVASTGEMSRVALALRALVASRRRRVLVFDEIDTGVGADLGAVIAEKLLALARDHQIICITHMPHIAAAANHHLVVRKTSDATRAVATVRPVSGTERRAEIERMIGGAGSAARGLAEELLGRRRAVPRTAGTRP